MSGYLERLTRELVGSGGALRPAPVSGVGPAPARSGAEGELAAPLELRSPPPPHRAEERLPVSGPSQATFFGPAQELPPERPGTGPSFHDGERRGAEPGALRREAGSVAAAPPPQSPDRASPPERPAPPLPSSLPEPGQQRTGSDRLGPEPGAAQRPVEEIFAAPPRERPPASERVLPTPILSPPEEPRSAVFSGREASPGMSGARPEPSESAPYPATRQPASAAVAPPGNVPAMLRPPAPAPTAASREPDEIHIHIGRIEVTATQPERPQRPAPVRKGPSLEEYLKRSEGRAR